MAEIERDKHAGPVPEEAWDADEQARSEKGRVQIFNATRPGGLDGWTMDLDQYQAVHDLIVAPRGDVSLAIMEVGGFIGIDSKWVAVPADMFEPGDNGQFVLPKATEEELTKMPSFRYAQ